MTYTHALFFVVLAIAGQEDSVWVWLEATWCVGVARDNMVCGCG